MEGLHPEERGVLSEVGLPSCARPTGALTASEGRSWDSIEHRFDDNIITTKVDEVLGWARKSSLWPMTFGLACCAIEMMAAGGPRFDIARFGAEVFRASPRQADLMIVAGTVTKKMAPGAPPALRSDARAQVGHLDGRLLERGRPVPDLRVLQGVDKIVPVDVYVSGCPPRPEALLYGLMRLQDKIQKETAVLRRARVIPAGGDRTRPRRGSGLAHVESRREFFRRLLLIDLSRGSGSRCATRRSRRSRSSTRRSAGRSRPVPRRAASAGRPENGAQTCIVCDQCAKACPDDLIALGGHREPGQKIKILDYFDFNLSRCSFCGLVREVCPTKPIKALIMSEDYELGTYTRAGADPADRRDVRRSADPGLHALTRA